MAIIDWLPSVDPINTSRGANTFGGGQGSGTVRKKPIPNNPSLTHRNGVRSLANTAGDFYWALTNGQKTPWATWAANNGIARPFPVGKYQQGYAGFLTVTLPLLMAGDSIRMTPPGPIPLVVVQTITLARIDKDTIRATISPPALGVNKRIYLRQARPGPGYRNSTPENGYLADFSGTNPGTPHDFTTHFQHLTGWHCRYWVGIQEFTGRRSIETQFDL